MDKSCVFSQFPFPGQKLISLAAQHPILYDKDQSKYLNNHIKENRWLTKTLSYNKDVANMSVQKGLAVKAS